MTVHRFRTHNAPPQEDAETAPTESLTCPKCGVEGIRSYVALERHLTTCEQQDQQKERAYKAYPSGELKCEKCGREFQTLKSLNWHNSRPCGSDTCPFCQQQFPTVKARANQKWCAKNPGRMITIKGCAGTGRYRCEKCPYTCKQAVYLSRHMHTVHGERSSEQTSSPVAEVHVGSRGERE